MRGTVKQFKDTLDVMKKIYPFEDDKTRMETENVMAMQHDTLYIETVDEPTGVRITMSRRVCGKLEDKV